MSDTIHLELVTPSSLHFSGEVTMVVIPGAEGDFGVLPNHAPLISQIRPGVVTIYKEGGEQESLFISGGYSDVIPTRCTVLAQEILKFSEITGDLLESRREKAQATIRRAETELVKAKAEAELAVLDIMESVKKAA